MGNASGFPSTGPWTPDSEGLQVVVWNAAGYDETYQHTREPETAATEFKDWGVAVVICPESDDYNREAFENAGYDVIRNHDLNIFYDSEIMYPDGDAVSATLPKGPGAHQHPGKALSQWFKLDDDTTVLITAAHGGHYGKPKNPDEESASVALQALRDLQTQMEFWHADKCVVGGDFNEIGNLIEWYPDRFHPLPRSTKNQIQPHPGKTHPYEKHSDHIWAGGKDVGDAEARVGDAYGSDHCCVIMIGI